MWAPRPPEASSAAGAGLAAAWAALASLLLLQLVAATLPLQERDTDFRPQAFQVSSIKRNLRGRLGPRRPAPMLLAGGNRHAPNIESSDALASARLHWQGLEMLATSSMAAQANGWRPKLEELLSSTNHQRAAFSPGCSGSLHQFLDAMGAGKQHALQALDASTKHLPSGVLWGSLADLGNYDQCLSLSGFQYCTIHAKPALHHSAPSSQRHPQAVPPHLTLCSRLPSLLDNSSALSHLSHNSQHFYFGSLRLSVCLPIGCNRRELQLLLANYLSINKHRNLANHLSAHLKGCQTSASLAAHLDTLQECIVWLLGALFGLVVVASLEDVRMSYKRFGAPTQDTGSGNVTKSWHYQVYQANQHLLACTGSPARVQLNPLLASQHQQQCSPSSSLHHRSIKNNRGHRNNTSHQQSNNSHQLPQSQQYNKRNFRNFLHCFSLQSNLQALTRNSPIVIELDTRFFHGLKSLTMMWIIFAHTCSLASLEMMSNVFVWAELLCGSRLLQALLNVNLAASTFYLMSGLTGCLEIGRKCPSLRVVLWKSIGLDETSVKSQQQQHAADQHQISSHLNSPTGSTSTLTPHENIRGSVNNSSPKHSSFSDNEDPHRAWPRDFRPLNWMLEKHLSMTPAHAAVVALSILMPALGSGPFWPETMQPLSQVCRQQWLSNLLYVNNLPVLPASWNHSCLPGSWWLSNELQFFGVTLLLLALLYLKMAKLAAMFVFVLILACSAATFAVTLQQDLPPAPPTTLQATPLDQSMHTLYHEPWPYLPCYLIGLLTGFLLMLKNHIGSLSSAWSALIWLLVPVALVALLNCLYPWNMGIPVEPLLTGFHGSTFRTLWASCCAWLVFSLACKPTCLVSRFLSWTGFSLTGRLTYSTFLVHTLVINYQLASTRQSIDSSMVGLMARFAANLLLSYLAALLLNLVVERPFVRMQNLLLGSQKTMDSLSIHKSSSSPSSSCTINRSDIDGVESMLKNGPNLLKPGESIEATRSTGLNSELVASHIPKAPPPPPTHGGVPVGTAKGSSRLLMDERAQLDAEFQRKLAQAIGRGFRIRSKLANSDGTTRVSVNKSENKKWLAPQQAALRSKLEFGTFMQATQAGHPTTSANL